MARIVVLDLLFNWPPEGGARVDTLYLTRYLSESHETTLLVPRLADEFPRGRIDVPREQLGIDLRTPAVPEVQDYRALLAWLRETLAELGTQRLIVGDAWHLKPRLLAGLAEYRPIVRFYAHEGLCVKGHGHRYRDERVCNVDTLACPDEFTAHCRGCWQSWSETTTTRVFDREMELAAIWDGTYLDDLRRGLAAARAVVVTNTEMVTRLSPHTPHVVLQPMGVDRRRFAPAGPPAGRRFLLHGRAYDYLKGAHVLIEAARRLRASRDGFTVALTGLPPRIDPHSLPDGIEVQSPVPHDAVPGLIASALACVLPPLWPEPLPLAALEAMACGRPLIVSAVGGLPDLVRDGENGLLVPPNDPDALAAAMGRLLDDPALAQQLAADACATIQRYDWSDLHRRAYDPLLTNG